MGCAQNDSNRQYDHMLFVSHYGRIYTINIELLCAAEGAPTESRYYAHVVAVCLAVLMFANFQF